MDWIPLVIICGAGAILVLAVYIVRKGLES